jgi:hypothetical protein
VPKKPSKPKAARPQFDAEPVEDDEPVPFTMDDDGNMVLRRSATKPKAKGKANGKGKGKGGGRKPA